MHVCVYVCIGKYEPKAKGKWACFHIKLELNIFKVRPYETRARPVLGRKGRNGYFCLELPRPILLSGLCTSVRVSVSVPDCRRLLGAVVRARVCSVYAEILLEGNVTFFQALDQKIS